MSKPKKDWEWVVNEAIVIVLLATLVVLLYGLSETIRIGSDILNIITGG